MSSRKSKQKESILKVLKQTTSHPNAEWIYQQVKKEIPRISLGTVYRNLRLMKDSGTILGVCASTGIEHYDAKITEHCHFRCDRCRGIFDVEEEVDQKLEEKVAANTGLKVTGHSLEFTGLCHECQDK
jgi:Fur family transcriptional regulator, peroxide stress response regulator